MYHYPLSTALFVISTLVTLQSAGLFVIWRLLVLKYGVVGQELERRDGVGVASYRGTHGLDGLNLEESEESDGESSIADDDFDDD